MLLKIYITRTFDWCVGVPLRQWRIMWREMHVFKFIGELLLVGTIMSCAI
ncbi:MAG: hypothetical protein IGNPGNKH_00022 [Sodalis sp. Ffu]|nr:MAG: hypothetical protein IGNPGNKH_00022 [Sodalis sp. Ffu]